MLYTHVRKKCYAVFWRIRWPDKSAGGSVFDRPRGSVFERRHRRKRVALVVFLRGVNVGGHRTFRPTMLAEQLKHLDAVNIGAAGTFVIRQPVTRAQLRPELARRLPLDAAIMLCQGRETARPMPWNPFADPPVQPAVVR